MEIADNIVDKIYDNQKTHSKLRGHNPPSYTKCELRDWMIRQSNYKILCNNWIESGYIKDFKPSVDRLDDSKGYSFDNIRLITFRENYLQRAKDTSKKVMAKFCGQTEIYDSISEAAKKNGISENGISACCNGKALTAGCFEWEFVDA